MEKSSAKGPLVVLTKGKWVTKTNEWNYTSRDNEAKGVVDIHAMKIANESLVSVGKLTLDAFPGVPPTSMQSIDVPDYLGAVTGNRFCFVYSPQKNQRVFALYEVDEASKKLNVKSQFKFETQIAPTAIIAIGDKVFLGFPGQVGLVDLTQANLSLNLFHNWQEQTWGQNDLKTIDAFAYDPASKSELVAIDDVIWPKYAFTYKISEKEMPKNTGKFDLPSGPNEHYKDAAKSGDRVVLTAKYGHRGGQGNNIVVLDGSKPVWTISEHAPWDDDKEGLELFVGEEFTPHSSVGLLNKNIVLVTAGKRGVIAIPIDQIKREKKKIDRSTYEVSVPHGVKNLHVGTSAEHLAIMVVNKKSTALVLGTTEKDSVLSEVKWNDKSNDLEVVRSHNVQGLFERFYTEI